MSTYAGSDGIVKISDNTIAEVKSWSLEENSDALDCSSIGTSWRKFRPSIKSWSGSIDAFWHSLDSGQMRLKIGEVIELSLYPSGVEDSKKYFTGNAIITSVSRNASFDGMVEVSFNFQGSGRLYQKIIGYDTEIEKDNHEDKPYSEFRNDSKNDDWQPVDNTGLDQVDDSGSGDMAFEDDLQGVNTTSRSADTDEDKNTSHTDYTKTQRKGDL